MFEKAVAAHGVPQRLLSDNGSALNPSRRGLLGQLVVHLMALGVEPIAHAKAPNRHRCPETSHGRRASVMAGLERMFP